ncbi:response regulator, partial [Thioclava sp. BHET1]
VLINLVSNALKFTHNGTVSIEVEALGRSGARRAVEFRVTDTGCGIAEADLERVFLDFETLDSSYGRNAGGTGLGLGIARRLVKAMGGEIGAESEQGEGSLFWLRVPLEIDLGADRPEERPVSPVLSRPLDLLVVEDNAINRLVLREMLTAEGHSVTEAENGADGVRRAEAHRFDAILMDISMPVMDGPQATREIRAGQGRSRDIPIIAVTAHALPQEMEAFRAAGMSDCVTKPIEPVELGRALARCCGGGEAEGETLPAAAPPEEREAGESKAGDGEIGDGEAAALVDPTQLHWLGSRLPPEQMQALITRYLGELDAALAELGAAEGGGQAMTELLALVHRTAGSASVLGLVALHRRLAEAERLGKAGDRPAMLAALAALGGIWAISRPELLSAAAQSCRDPVRTKG